MDLDKQLLLGIISEAEYYIRFRIERLDMVYLYLKHFKSPDVEMDRQSYNIIRLN